MNIYISGPITNNEIQGVKFRFNRAAIKIQAKGHTAVNPIDMADWGLTWRTYMALAKVTICSGDIDAIYLMPGWEASRGCNLEKKWAQRQGVPVYFSIEEGEDAWMQRNI